MLLFIILLISLPGVIIYLCNRMPILDRVGVVAITFIGGICVSILASVLNQLVPMATQQSIQAWQASQSNVLDISIALALPMLIFSVDIRQSIYSAKRIMFAMLLAVLSVVSVGLLLAVIFQSWVSDMWQYAGMALGAYIGGGVNMAVIKTAIHADESAFILMTGYDLLVSSLYLLFILSCSVPIVTRVLSPYQSLSHDKDKNKHQTNQCTDRLAKPDRDASLTKLPNTQGQTQSLAVDFDESASRFRVLLQPSMLKYHMASLVIAGMIVGLSVYLSGFAPAELSATMTIVLITVLAMIASINPRVNSLPTSYRLGMYLVMVFCFTIGSMFDIQMFYQMNVAVLGFVVLLIVLSFMLHLLLCYLFKIDRDSFLVTSVATIMSLPFIPLICNRLNNRELLVAGLSVAILGYIGGTYLGIAIAYLLRVAW